MGKINGERASSRHRFRDVTDHAKDVVIPNAYDRQMLLPASASHGLMRLVEPRMNPDWIDHLDPIERLSIGRRWYS